MSVCGLAGVKQKKTLSCYLKIFYSIKHIAYAAPQSTVDLSTFNNPNNSALNMNVCAIFDIIVPNGATRVNNIYRKWCDKFIEERSKR